MTIDREGNLIPGQTWWYEDGPLIRDADNQYNTEFFIAVPFNDEQRKQYKQIAELKKNLRETDYKAIKKSDGEYTEEEYAPIREQRALWRTRIREIEKSFNPPTLTREEIDEAERKAMEKLKAQIEEQTGKKVASIHETVEE